MKDYLGFENARNKQHAAVYTQLMKMGLEDKGHSVAILIGHHLTFEVDSDLQTENEIPSADCLMFDHDIMTRVFGKGAIPLMQRLASLPCEERDFLLEEALENVGWWRSKFK